MKFIISCLMGLALLPGTASADNRDLLQPGSLVSFKVRHPNGKRAQGQFTGLVEQHKDGVVDFGTFAVVADLIDEASIQSPKVGDLISVNVASDDGEYVSRHAGVFKSFEKGVLRFGNSSVPARILVGNMTIINPGQEAFVKIKVGDKVKGQFVTYSGNDGYRVRFDYDSLEIHETSLVSVQAVHKNKFEKEEEAKRKQRSCAGDL